MRTAKQIIDNIRWNKNILNKSKYKIGYFDRISNGIKYFYFSDIIFEQNDEFALTIRNRSIKNKSGIIYIPYHRLRIVYDDSNKIIWRRKKII